ncbi:esterase [Bacillus sp. LL01]|uniref:2-succinyl-6-hydroxy-2, 4-cyclohexadiene-1-carboxylate synthase n=1 Tax=Bacillus sp. LL01 TaxID=1665556 RepID=UPI00064CED46|nr:2-succinyl-6-hydroxy-2,4-cyclohexadiene-1-carboxylate synthase [Bacillus sp. LL01]KMJ57711.1 esterase [Bacillus sp. LL01]
MKINGVSYHVEIIGGGEHHVLMLHGFTGKGANFKDMLADFPHSDCYTFILIDQLGHGKSESPMQSKRYSMENTTADLKAILDHLGISRVSLYGYSMGGRLALSFATSHPSMVRKLVLESASPGLATKEERLKRKQADEKLADRIQNEGLEAFVEFWTNIPLFQSQKKLPESKQAEVHEQRMGNNVVGLANSLRGVGTGVQPSYWEHLRLIEFAVLIAAGEWDEKFVLIAQEMENRIEKSHFIKISEAGHAIHVEQPRKFGKIVSEFLSN